MAREPDLGQIWARILPRRATTVACSASARFRRQRPDAGALEPAWDASGNAFARHGDDAAFGAIAAARTVARTGAAGAMWARGRVGWCCLPSVVQEGGSQAGRSPWRCILPSCAGDEWRCWVVVVAEVGRREVLPMVEATLLRHVAWRCGGWRRDEWRRRGHTVFAPSCPMRRRGRVVGSMSSKLGR
jgi:hypothetical protein